MIMYKLQRQGATAPCLAFGTDFVETSENAT